jgi:4-alpha-glucanotransferase
VEIAAREGAAFVGTNPLHSLWNEGPHVCPYLPVSRLFRSELYVDIDDVPELAHEPLARGLVASRAFQRDLAHARAARDVDYERVVTRKREVLRLLHARHRASGAVDPSRTHDYRRYVEHEGKALLDYATFRAIADQMGPRRRDWQSWPAKWQHPDAREVHLFRAEHGTDVDFHMWVQFELDRQLGGVAAAARDAGLAVGLFGDLAVGTSGGGIDPWSFPHLFATGASVGAPPDDFSTAGQDWSLPPLIPHRLRADGYMYWRRLLRAAFRHMGMLRIDHVMALERLFWIPHGEPASAGAYVRYPLREMLAVLAQESRRAGAIVVGEDLGTVPEGLRERLHEQQILSMRVLVFERDEHGAFRPPHHYPERCLASANTHDLVPLAGFASARDLELRRLAGHIATDEDLERARADRRAAYHRLLDRLRAEGLLEPDEAEPPADRLLGAVHAFLGRTPARLMAISLDDLAGERDPVNLPGVGAHGHPSWTRRMSVSLEDLAASPLARAGLDAIPPERCAR